MAKKARKDPFKLFTAIRDLELSGYDKQIASKKQIENVFMRTNYCSICNAILSTLV